ncbi:MAG: galactose-1-epimerase [Verrucomicrobia bacterium]|nr:MAG: galactose-1-epimerase [Verrucomicrobiota bacterium]
MKRLFLAISAILTAAACVAEGVEISKSPFGKTADGEAVTEYELKNSRGMTVKVLDFGATITRISVPDRNGKFKNVALSLPSVSDYETKSPYFGALIGRVANRIARAKFSLNGTEYKLAANDGQNSIHGGNRGFDKRMWKVREVSGKSGAGLVFSRVSPHMEEGYPGNLSVEVAYTLTDNNELIFDYRAVSDADTVCNLTQHAYFNLRGAGYGSVLGHVIKINADKFTPVNVVLIPTGERRPVKGTPFDFRKPAKIGDRISMDDVQLRLAGGFDHNWCLNNPNGEMVEAVEVYEPNTGRVMRVYTDQIGVQFYTGNFLDGSLKSPEGNAYGHRGAFVLETQHYPDSPNQDGFPPVVLRRGEVYKTRTVFQFDTRE